MDRPATHGAALTDRPVSFRLATLVVAAILPTIVSGNGPDTCRSIADDKERLACYDALAVETIQTKEPLTTASAESLFGRDAAQTSAALQQQTGISQAQTLDAEIGSVETRANGKLLISLQNNQRWEQIDGRPLALVPGDPVRIRRSALGSYLLYKQAGGRSVRVRRID